MESMIARGPMTVVLVFSPSCPHCHTYMPLWKELERERTKKANLVSVRSDIYDQTPLSETAPVSSVPTVLLVDKNGRVTEAEEPRNMTMMKNVVRTGSTAAPTAGATTEANLSEALRSAAASSSMKATSQPQQQSEPIRAVLPGTTTSENPLPALPATPVSEAMEPVEPSVQSGGNPWAAFLMAARQAAPAAALLGAYAALPNRSSGLGPARSRRRTTRRRRTIRRRQ